MFCLERFVTSSRVVRIHKPAVVMHVDCLHSATLPTILQLEPASPVEPKVEKLPARSDSFNARFVGRCAVCQQRVPTGALIVAVSQPGNPGRYAHLGCTEPWET